MPDDNHVASTDSSGTPVVGLKYDVYERQIAILWMTKDDIEHFESRYQDKSLFQGIALFFISASLPLFIEKLVDYMGTKNPTDAALVIVCMVSFFIGLFFQYFAVSRKRGLETFKQELFKRERKLETKFYMVDGSSTPEHKAGEAA